MYEKGGGGCGESMPGGKTPVAKFGGDVCDSKSCELINGDVIGDAKRAAPIKKFASVRSGCGE